MAKLWRECSRSTQNEENSREEKNTTDAGINEKKEHNETGNPPLWCKELNLDLNWIEYI